MFSIRRAQKSLQTACRLRGMTTKAPSGEKAQKASTSISKSSCQADTILPGLNYLKGQEPVLAKPDEWYPEWLWTILEPKKLENDGPGGRFERMQRRTESKQRIKERNFMLTQ